MGNTKIPFTNPMLILFYSALLNQPFVMLLGTPIGTPVPVFPKLEQATTPAADAATNKANAATTSTTAAVSDTSSLPSLSLSELSERIIATGLTIRDMKSKKVPKDELQPKIDELLQWKQMYQKLNNGVAYDAASANK